MAAATSWFIRDSQQNLHGSKKPPCKAGGLKNWALTASDSRLTCGVLNSAHEDHTQHHCSSCCRQGTIPQQKDCPGPSQHCRPARSFPGSDQNLSQCAKHKIRSFLHKNKNKSARAFCLVWQGALQAGHDGRGMRRKREIERSDPKWSWEGCGLYEWQASTAMTNQCSYIQKLHFCWTLSHC